ncbi:MULTISPECIES: 1-hydroxycarotenoid 3,4-desaturase CrtD [unclassified Roseitalea]|uniref:1-hydroxycarotenoid 3,4-desaturase CrtD n=1 Tax=unclassified Roseitalea TaxID=2639107 RepID=UPI00273D8ECE|nr:MULTISPECIES: 1-hydroxycarotenoid 3,4-desaturase CrtD [unclassified Roseitalea]
MNTIGQRQRIVVIGAGMGGLAASIRLAGHGYDVLVIEAQESPGGKARHVAVDDAHIDAGPTVFTMKWVFDRLLAEKGLALEDEVELGQAGTLARHAWPDGSMLDLHADIDASVEAIAEFSDRANAEGYRRFCSHSRAIFETLKEPFIAGQRPSMAGFIARLGPLSIRRHLMLKPFTMLWPALGRYFTDPRLRQLFARYATYVGSSPFMTPATLMLIAHVEQDGVWTVRGGMHALAQGLVRLGARCGVRHRFGARVERIVTHGSRVTGVVLEDGEAVEASAIVFNGDVSALAGGLLGKAATAAGAKPVPPDKRSISAIAVAGLMAPPDFPLAHHTVFFGSDYRDEFAAIFERRTVTAEPTTYICAQDRASDGTLSEAARKAGRERFLMLINAPADGDLKDYTAGEIDRCMDKAMTVLRRGGLTLDRAAMRVHTTAPDGFARLFPGSGGAIYGRASHGWMASFKRPGARTRIWGLYLAGGSVHPGPGVPMATLSGMLAGDAFLSDRFSTARFQDAAISGGMSTE